MLNSVTFAQDDSLEQSLTAELAKKLQGNSQKQPMILLLGGFQGSGKSSLISRLKKVHDDINIISTDEIRQSLFDRKIKISPQFTKSVDIIFKNLFKICTDQRSHIIIDANAHAQRLEAIQALLKELQPAYSVVTICLTASENTLKNRVAKRQSIEGLYQGTVSDLVATLASKKLNPADYQLLIDTDQNNCDAVFHLAEQVLKPYFP